MKKALLNALCSGLMLLPLLVSAAEVTGKLDSFSIRTKTLVVDGIEYSVDIENLNISYNGAYMGADALAPGIRVQLIIDEEVSAAGSDNIVRMRILTNKSELDS